MTIFSLFKETSTDENREKKEIIHKEINQIIDEKSKAKESNVKEISKETYKNTIEHVTDEFGDIMPETQRVRIDIERKNHLPIVLAPEVYAKRFPEADPAVLGHYDAEGRVFLKEGSPETVTHVTTHEALHLTSYKEVDDFNPELKVYQSGIRETTYKENRLEEDKNRALNEGITEMYAMREMMQRGDISSIEAVTAYPEAQRKAYELQEIVGSDVIQKAYFGGDLELLKSEVNRLSFGDETAWNRYSENVDVLEYGTDENEIRHARIKLTVQNAIMTSFRESEAHDKPNQDNV